MSYSHLKLHSFVFGHMGEVVITENTTLRYQTLANISINVLEKCRSNINSNLSSVLVCFGSLATYLDAPLCSPAVPNFVCLSPGTGQRAYTVGLSELFLLMLENSDGSRVCCPKNQNNGLKESELQS